MDRMDMSAIRLEFERNGVTRELDDMDLLIIKSRRKKALPAYEIDDKLVDAIEKTRQSLENLKPLNGRQHCVFCKNNKEQPCVYSTHLVKNEKGEVTCPILYKYVCPMCHATGKKAHTIKYCPFNEGYSVDCIFKTTRNGAGRRRDKRCTQINKEHSEYQLGLSSSWLYRS